MKRPRRGAGTCARPASRSATKRRRTQDNTDMTNQIQDAYIVAATRTPVGKAPKGVFRNPRPADMLAHVSTAVIAQAQGIDATPIEEAITGRAQPEGAQDANDRKPVGEGKRE